MPLVSIVVPIYKVEKYLHQCIDSILAQTLTDIELILVDDGSPDSCPAIVDEYAAADSRVIAIHQPNGGYGKAVNTGIARASAPYIGIVEPDDYIEPTMYELLYASAKKCEADVTKCWFFDHLDTPSATHDKPFPLPQPPPENTPFCIQEQAQLLQYHPSVWTCLYKADFLRRHGIRMIEVPGSGWTDNPFQVQTLCLAESIVFLNTPCYHWRRVNVEAADDLKDYRIPFDRCDYIHQWLQEQGITHPAILANLHARELNYVLLVSRKRDIEDKADCCSRIAELCRRMDRRVFNTQPLPRKLRKALFLCRLSPAFFILTRQLRQMLKRRKR